jgi:hypothetical protein
MIGLLLSLATSCAAPTPRVTETPVHAGTASPGDLFPEPKSGISIHLEPGKDMKLDELLAEFSKATGLHLVVNRETAAILKQTPTGLMDSLEIPKSEVYPVVESLLIQNEVLLTALTDKEPRLFAVSSLTGGALRGSFRTNAVFVPVADIPAYARHPAILVTTVINLPSTDVRTLTNSIRTMFTDANTQQIIPVGNSNSLIITGFGPPVASIVSMLSSVDDAARRDAEEAAKKAKEHPQPAPTTPPEPPR